MHRLVAILAIALLLPLLPPTAPVAEASFTVLADETESRFPRELVFRLRATADREIKNIQVNMMIGRERVSSYGYPEFTPGTTVEAEYVLRTGADRYIPPMSKITYWYLIEDSAGERYETERKTIRYEDPQYQWQQLEHEQLIVFYHDLPTERAQRIADAGMQTIAEAKSAFGVDVSNQIAIVVYNSREQMNAALPPQSQAVQEALVTLGQAHSEHDVVLVLDYLGNDQELIETTRHELQHVITHQATDNPYSQLPLWLNEGLAVFVQGSGQEGYAAYVSRAQRQGSVFYLRDLAGRPGRPEENLLLYGQGYLVVKYLHDQYGPASLSTLLKAYRDGKTTDQAFTEAFGKPLDAIDTEWRATLGLPPVPERSNPLGSSGPSTVPTVVPLGAQPSGGAPTTAPSSAAEPAPVAEPTTAPAPTQAAEPDSSLPLIAGVAVVAVIVLVGGGLALSRRR